MKLKNKKNKKLNQTKVYINDSHDDEIEEDEEENELKAYSEARKARIYKKKRRKKRIISLLVFVLVIALIYLNWNVIAPTPLSESIQSFFSEFGKNQYPVDFEEGTMKTAVAVGSNVGILTDTSFLIYSQNGDKIASRPHGFNDPAAVSGGGKALIYDRGGKQFRVETRFGEPMSSAAAYDITSAAMGDKGNFAVITQADNYLSELTVYNNSNKPVFKWDSTKGRILTASLSPDGGKLAAVVTGARKGEIFSDIYIFSLSSEKPLAIKQYDNTLLYSIRFKDSKRIAAVGDQKSVFLYVSGEQKSEYDYGSNELLNCCNLDGPLILAFKNGADSSTVISLDGEGKVLGKSVTSGSVKYVSFGGDFVSALSDSKVFISKEDLKQQTAVSVPVGVQTVLNIKKYLFVIGTQSVSRYDLK